MVEKGVEFKRNFTEMYTEIVENLQNKTLTVTTIRVSLKVTSNKSIWKNSLLTEKKSRLQKNLIRSFPNDFFKGL